MTNDDITSDWRYMGQESYLKPLVWEFGNWVPINPANDHDHCEFCGIKFSSNDNDLDYGWHDQDRYRWICQKCFDDFKNYCGLLKAQQVAEKDAASRRPLA